MDKVVEARKEVVEEAYCLWRTCQASDPFCSPAEPHSLLLRHFLSLQLPNICSLTVFPTLGPLSFPPRTLPVPLAPPLFWASLSLSLHLFVNNWFHLSSTPLQSQLRFYTLRISLKGGFFGTRIFSLPSLLAARLPLEHCLDRKFGLQAQNSVLPWWMERGQVQSLSADMVCYELIWYFWLWSVPLHLPNGVIWLSQFWVACFKEVCR